MASRPDVDSFAPLHLFVTNSKAVPSVVKGSNRTFKH